MVYICLRIIGDALLEEVGLALEGDHVHEIEWVGHIVHLVVPQRNQQTIGDKFDVLTHELGIHSDQCNRQCI